MSAPGSFRAVSVDDQDRPNPCPPRFVKSQIYADPRVFKVIDNHAIDEARTNYRNFTDLIWNLVYKKDFSELERVRVIFRWMTTKNMYTIMFDNELPDSPEAVLGGMKDNKSTYARIFACLANFAGLHCVTLSGWAKGVEYKPGVPITDTPINHSWNAVLVDGYWQLVDCHWATRYLQAERNIPENLVYEYDDFYFFPPPTELVYSHCPEDPAWQLVYPARSRAEFEDYPLVKSYFFTVGMHFCQHEKGILTTRNGILVLTLGTTKPAQFTFKLSFGEAMVEMISSVPLKRYVIQETVDNRLTFYFRCPREGHYYLTIFAQQAGSRVRTENIFKATCEYKIICDQAAADTRPYPLCSDSNWGPGAPVNQYGFTPTHKDAIVVAERGRVDVGFIKSRNVRLFARLTQDGTDHDVLERYINVREQDNQIIVTAQLPGRGEYGLEIYANEPDREGDTYTHMCQYLVSNLDGEVGVMYGEAYDRMDVKPGMAGGPMGQYQAGGAGYGPQSEYGTMQGPGGVGGQQYPGGMYGGIQQYNQTLDRNTNTGTYNAKWNNYGGGSSQYAGQGPQYGTLPGDRDRQAGTMGRDGYGPGGYNTAGRDGPGGYNTAGRDGPGGYNAAGRDGPGGYNTAGRDGPGGYNTASRDGPGGYNTAGRDGPGGYNKTGYGTTGRDGPGYGGPGGPAYGQDGQAYRTGDKNMPYGQYGQGQQPYGQNQQGINNMMAGMNLDGRNTDNGEDLPPPPPPMDGEDSAPQSNQHLAPEEPKRTPVEVVYVSSGKSPTTQRRAAADQNKGNKGGPPPVAPKKGVEVVYSSSSGGPGTQQSRGPGQGGPGTGPTTLGKKIAPPTAPKPQHTQGRSPRDSPKGSPSLARKTGSVEDLLRAQGMEISSGGEVSGGSNGYIPGEMYDSGPGPTIAQRAVPISVVHHQQDNAEPNKGNDQQRLALQPGTYGARRLEPETEYKPHPVKMYTSSITVNPPTNFQPVPINETEDQAPQPLPPSMPPKPFRSTHVFENVDTHAVEVSKEEHKSFRDLVWHLIYARDISNELEKARAIFLWLCSKDLAQLQFDNIQKGSPEEILMSLRQSQTTYAVVYETLCSYAGLHCKTISGYAKGAEYKPGMQFTGEQGQHSWNSVLVNGAWRLVDCHWAARRLVGKKVTTENVRYELDEYYFMPDPHQLIFTHYPEDTNWQLLEKNITLYDFENLVPVKSAFFKYGLQILSHREAVINTNREITVRIGCPPFKAKTLAFTFTLTFADGNEEYNGVKLSRYGMQEMVDNVSFFTIRPPKEGSYRLIIYAKDLTVQSKEGVYGGVCEYEVRVAQKPSNAQTFPPCVHTSWGPGDSLHKYDIIPLQNGAIFSTVNGQAEVKFKLTNELRFTAKMKSNDKDDKALAGFILHRTVNNVAVFTIRAPQPGEYGLEIYANDPEQDGNSLYHAFQYLIISSENVGQAEPLPTLPTGYLGMQPCMKKLGMTAVSHPDPYLQTDSGDLQITFGTNEPLRTTSQLIYVSGNQSVDSSDYILQQSQQEAVSFMLKLPKTGLYKFQLYALPFSDQSENLPGVYNYLINCHNTYATLVPFPKQYGQWKEGCYLYEPLEGQLSANRPAKGSSASYQSIYFKVEVPGAKSVAVVLGEDWTQLEQKSGQTAWEADVPMDKHWGHESKAALCANFGSVKASYSTLLEFSL